MAVTQSTLSATRIEFGLIQDIDVEANAYCVRTESSEVPHYNIPIVSPAQDQTSSAGFRFIPKVGSTCLVLTTGDNKRCILGFLNPDEAGSYNNGFPTGNSGDIDMFGTDGNFLRLRAGGIVQIGSKAICSSIYLPTRNIIHNISENFIIDTLAGSLEFKVDRPEDSSDGHSKTSLNIAVKEFSDDSKELININMGGSKLAFSLLIKDSGISNNERINIKMDKTGTIDITLSKEFKLYSKGNMTIKTDADTTTTAKNINLKASSDIKTTAINTNITSSSTTTIGGSSVNLNGSINKLNKTAKFPVVRMSPDFIAFIAAGVALGMPNPLQHYAVDTLA